MTFSILKEKQEQKEDVKKFLHNIFVDQKITHKFLSKIIEILENSF